MISVYININASLFFGLATPIELYTFDRNLPDSQTNPPWKYIEMVGISGNTVNLRLKWNIVNSPLCNTDHRRHSSYSHQGWTHNLFILYISFFFLLYIKPLFMPWVSCVPHVRVDYKCMSILPGDFAQYSNTKKKKKNFHSEFLPIYPCLWKLYL